MNLELNAIDSNDDITGFRHIFGKQNLFKFFSIGSLDKTYYPRNQKSESPFELSFRLGKRTHFYSQTKYTMTQWAIDIGGFSRAMFVLGMVFAHFVAIRLYKAALITDTFLVQEKKIS